MRVEPEPEIQLTGEAGPATTVETAAAPGPRPWHDSGGHEDFTRRILLVSYHFPPSTRIGALRWQRFSEHFAEQGWALDVLMLEPSPDPVFDPALLRELPAGLRCFAIPDGEHPVRRIEQAIHSSVHSVSSEKPVPDRGRSFDGHDEGPVASRTLPDSFHRSQVRWRLDTLRGWLRLYWSWLYPEMERVWTRRAATTGIRLARSTDYAVVISSGPPHMNHLAGLRISRRIGAPFVMDMRDAWSRTARVIEPLGSPLWFRLAGWREARAVGAAALVVTNTELLEQEMRKTYPEAVDRIVTIRNGFDQGPMERPAPDLSKRFTIRFAGTIYMGRDPRPLFEAAARLLRERELTPDEFGIDLIGGVKRFGDLPVRDLARAAGIEEFVTIGPWRDRTEAARFMADASVLVTLPWSNDLAIPGKLYEYMRFPAWILALTEHDSAVAALLEGTEADVVPASDPEAIAAALRKRHDQHRSGQRAQPLARDERFSRRSQALRFLSRLEEITVASGEEEVRL